MNDEEIEKKLEQLRKMHFVWAHIDVVADILEGLAKRVSAIENVLKNMDFN